MFVGQTGVGRVIQRACELMKEGKDVRANGAIPLDIIQKYVNFWASSSTDLYGGEVSSNAANFFSAGLKGRAFEKKYDDHQALEGIYTHERWVDGKIIETETPLRNAMNEVLRDAYVEDNLKGIDYWNRICERYGIDYRFTLPHRRFHRKIGEFAGSWFDLQGNPIDESTWNQNVSEWLPTEEDRAYVKSLMVACHEPGKYANWIAAPAKGINGQPVDYEYVRL